MNDPETFRTLSIIGAAAVCSALIVFGVGSRPSPAGGRIAPSSPREWLSHWFHALEFLVCCCAMLTWSGAVYRLPARMSEAAVHLAFALPVALALSAVVVWKRERRLAVTGLMWAAAAAVGAFFPSVPVTKIA